MCSFIERMGSPHLREAHLTGRWVHTAASALENFALPVRAVTSCAMLL